MQMHKHVMSIASLKFQTSIIHIFSYSLIMQLLKLSVLIQIKWGIALLYDVSHHQVAKLIDQENYYPRKSDANNQK